MWIYQVMMTPPLSLGSCATCQEVIYEMNESDHFIRSEWTLESHSPISSTIHISTKIDKKSWIFFQKSLDHINQMSFSDATEFELDISVQYYIISHYLDISIVSVFRSVDCFLRRNDRLIIFIPISEFCESLTDRRIKVPIRILSHFYGILDHIPSIDIELSMTSRIEF